MNTITVERLFQKIGEQLVTIQLLQEQNATLQSRIAELETPATPREHKTE